MVNPFMMSESIGVVFLINIGQKMLDIKPVFSQLNWTIIWSQTHKTFMKIE